MPEGAGYKAKAAFQMGAPQSAYGTVAAAGAGDLVPLVSEGIERTVDLVADNAVRGRAGISGRDVTKQGGAGTLTLDGVYRGLDALFACALGLCPGDSPELVAAGVYRHTFVPDEDLAAQCWTAGDGLTAGTGIAAGDKKVRRGTLVLDKGVSLWEWASVMAQSMTLRVSAQGVQVEVEAAPRALDLASAVNTDSSGWTVGEDPRPLMLTDAVLWVDGYSAATALSSADAVGFSAFELRLANNLAVAQDSQSGLYVAEPRRNGKRQVTGSITLPRYEADTFLGDHADQATLMAMLRFTGGEIGATGYERTLWVWLPSFTLDNVSAQVSGPGLLPVELTFTAQLPAAAPAGFPAWATKELLIQTQHGGGTNPLVQ